jgi:hypothetical protein
MAKTVEYEGYTIHSTPRIYAPDIEWPLTIDVANVQWVSGQMFGLAFFQIRDTEHQRLEQVIRDLMEG